MESKIILRRANLGDGNVLLDWRNDPNVRRVSHNKTMILVEDHFEWLSNVLQSSAKLLYLAEEGGVPVGSVRADFDGVSWELSWTVAPEARGRGVAKEMVFLLSKRISASIRAEVLSGNEASIKVAEYVGMSFVEQIGEILHYSKP